MQQNKISILSTRPINEQLIKNAAKRNITIDIHSFIKTEAIDDIEVYNEIETTSTQTATIVFTSMNAVNAVAARLHAYKPEWKIYCTGNTTKKLVSEYFGDDLIAGTAKDAIELAEKIIDAGVADEVTFFCGDKRRNELPDLLSQHNIKVNEIEVYTTTILPHTIEKDYDGILFFSPSAVEGFFKTNTVNTKTILFAIGDTTADALKKFSSNKITVSDKPDKENLIEKVINYFNTN